MSEQPSAATDHRQARTGWPLSGIALGGDYNPEQWPEPVWAEDVALMQQAGVTFATVGVFSWAHLEPAEGRFEFGWLDRVLDLLHAGGIAVDLATATASAPPWLPRAHPETLPVDRDGHRRWPGSRQSWCPSSPVFADLALRLVERMASRYAGHPALRLWHVSNELGCHNARCYCDVSAAAFRRWLLTRYGDLDTLNEAWATAFWSQRYGDIEEVLPPRVSTAQPNPIHELDYARFCSDELLGYYRAERDVLHRISPGTPVTTNLMVTSHVNGMDYWAWAPDQDVVSQDHYLDGRLADPTAELAFCGDLTRGLAGGGPWFLMEHSTSAVNWQPVNYAKPPGGLLRTSLSHVARGADAVGFFQWRASRAGAEKYHSGMVPHAGTDTAVWREVVRLGGVLRRCAAVAGSRVDSQVAMLFDWQSWWACEQGSHPTELVRYTDAARGAHAALVRRGIAVRMLPPGGDVAGCPLLLVPTLYLTDDATARAVAAHVEAGGHALVTCFSGIVDERDHIRLGGYPGAFRELLGIRTEEFFPLAPGQVVQVVVQVEDSEQADQSWPASVWTELTHLDGATALARYADGPLAGHPALTRHAVGAGVAWYLGTLPGAAGWDAVLTRVCEEAGVRGVVDLPPGVEAVRRSGEGGSFLFVINHSDAESRLPASGRDLVADADVDGTLVVPPGGVAVLEERG